MLNSSYCLSNEMPEHKDAIQKLKAASQHFTKILGKYEELNKEIVLIETNVHPSSDDHLEGLKKQRLHYKDELVSLMDKA